MKILVVGYGPGGIAAAVTAKTFAPETDVTILTEEEVSAHRKPGASLALQNPDTHALDIPDWSIEALRKKHIRVVQGVTVTDGDTSAKTLAVQSSDGKVSRKQYDILILATGGIPLVPDIPGTGLKGVYTMQSIVDALTLGRAVAKAKSVVIVGAGFSGLEVAERLLSMEKEVHLIMRSRPLRRLLEPDMSGELVSRLPASLHVHSGSSPKAVLGSKRVTAVAVDGEEIPTDAVVFMTGVRPNTSLAEGLGLRIGALGGIAVDSKMRTSEKSVYAVGDCIEMPDAYTGRTTLMPIGSVAARAGRQAGAAAAGSKKVYDDTSLRFQYDRVFKTDIICAGLSSEIAKDAGMNTRVTYLEDTTEFAKLALLVNPDGVLIGGQVLSSRMGATLGYQILERVRTHAHLDEHPLLEPRHERIKTMLERTLGPIRS